MKNAKEKERSFRIVDVADSDTSNNDHGIYHGKRPAQAALKAFTWHCRKTSEKSCTRIFTLEELSENKEETKKYVYKGVRKHLDSPKEIKRDGKTYFVYYQSFVHKAE